MKLHANARLNLGGRDRMTHLLEVGRPREGRRPRGLLDRS